MHNSGCETYTNMVKLLFEDVVKVKFQYERPDEARNWEEFNVIRTEVSINIEVSKTPKDGKSPFKWEVDFRFT